MNNRILVVDDSTAFQTLMAHLFEATGYELGFASNGAQALSKMDSFQPNMVLLDVEMPIMDGCATCRQMKQNIRTRHIPIVMMSADVTAERRATDAGCDIFLSKPFSLDEFQSTVESFMSVDHSLEALPRAS